jgi:RND family efflux transporter MFP subunit
VAAIGAASRQELERAHAEHTALVAEAESARVRVELLGGVASATSPREPSIGTADVPAPINGTVIERIANPGLNVDPASRFFTVADLSTVWVIAALYERDLARVAAGANATVTVPDRPGAARQGRVGYVDPELTAATRTGRVRIELWNERGDLRLGQYVDVELAAPPDHRAAAGAGGPPIVVPVSAIQHVSDRAVVYLADPSDPGRFIERDVQLGPTAGGRVQVLSGLAAGDLVVVEGRFSVRAEAERLGLHQRRPVAAIDPGGVAAGAGSSGTARPDGTDQSVEVSVTKAGFEPAALTLRAGVPARVTLLRTTDDTCATEVVFPSLGIRRGLPLNERVEIRFTPTSPEVAFVCGMNMFRGTAVVR